jgi:hypothetical protein
MSNDITEIKSTSQAYKTWALEARAKFISLRLKQDPSIRALYTRLIRTIAKKLSTMPAQLRSRHIKLIEQLIKEQSGVLTAELTAMLTGYIEQAVTAGAGYSKTITLDLLAKAGVSVPGIASMFARVNLQAIEACWARTQGGLHLSDRIWQQGENLRTTMRDIIQESVAIGQDAVKTARMLEQYVKTGKKTLVNDYPNMTKRMSSRIPGDVCYEALRLARTEMTAAFGEGTIAAARVSPSYTGMKWILSKSHPITDICDTNASYDGGLGKGVYKPGDEPVYPAHPQCLCVLISVHEQPEDFVQRLKRWEKNPDSEPALEDWYNDIYKKMAA